MCTDDEVRPKVRWAQTRLEVHLLFEIANATDVNMVSTTDGADLLLRGRDSVMNQPYCSYITFFAPVRPILGLLRVTEKSVRLTLRKVEGEHWTRLSLEPPSKLDFTATYDWDWNVDEISSTSSSDAEDEKEPIPPPAIKQPPGEHAGGLVERLPLPPSRQLHRRTPSWMVPRFDYFHMAFVIVLASLCSAMFSVLAVKSGWI